MTYLLPFAGQTLQPTDPICMPSQLPFNQTAGSPALQTSGGSQVILRYQKNGHITLPDIPPGKPSPGTVSVYGTSQSSPDDALLSIHHILDASGTGGTAAASYLARLLSTMGVAIRSMTVQSRSRDNPNFLMPWIRCRARICGVGIRLSCRPTWSLVVYSHCIGCGIGRHHLGRRRSRWKFIQHALM